MAELCRKYGGAASTAVTSGSQDRLWDLLCMEFTCSLCAPVGFLWVRGPKSQMFCWLVTLNCPQESPWWTEDPHLSSSHRHQRPGEGKAGKDTRHIPVSKNKTATASCYCYCITIPRVTNNTPFSSQADPTLTLLLQTLFTYNSIDCSCIHSSNQRPCLWSLQLPSLTQRWEQKHTTFVFAGTRKWKYCVQLELADLNTFL